MNISFEQAEIILRQKMRKGQIIFMVSILIGISVFIHSFIKGLSVLPMVSAIYFILLGAMNLPNINSCKSDINDYKNDNLLHKEGIAIDVFPEMENDEKNKNWYIFFLENEKKQLIEFMVSENPGDIKEGTPLKISFTKRTHLPVNVEKIKTS